MRTAFAMLVLLSLGSGVLVWQMAPLGGALGPDQADDLNSGSELEEEAKDGPAGGDFNASAKTGEGGSLVGTIVSSISIVTSFVGLVVMLPYELAKLDPVPWWAAYPVGILFQAVMGFLIAQFAGNRVMR